MELVTVTIRMDGNLHHFLRTLAGFEKISLSNLLLDLVHESLMIRKKNSKLPDWMNTENFGTVLEQEK